MKTYDLIIDESQTETSLQRDFWAVNAAIYGPSKHVESYNLRPVNRYMKWDQAKVHNPMFAAQLIEDHLAHFVNYLADGRFKLLLSFVRSEFEKEDFSFQHPIAHGQTLITHKAIRNISSTRARFDMHYFADGKIFTNPNFDQYAYDFLCDEIEASDPRNRLHLNFSRHNKKAANAASDLLCGLFAWYLNGYITGREHETAKAMNVSLRNSMALVALEKIEEALGIRLDPHNRSTLIVDHTSAGLDPETFRHWDDIPALEVMEVRPGTLTAVLE